MAKEQMFGAVAPNATPNPNPNPNPGTPDPNAPADIPPELVGKSAEEVFAIMRDEGNKVMGELAQKLTTTAPEAPPAKPTPAPRPAPYRPPPNPQQQQQQRTPTLLEDENGFMDAQFNQRLSPLVQQITASQRGTNRNVFVNQMKPGEYDKYGEEIETFVGGLAPQMQAHPDVYQQAYNFVVASHKDEIIDEEANKRTLATVTKVLASAGLTPEQITDQLRATAEGSGLNLPAQPAPAPAQSNLFQPNVGVRPPIQDPLRNTVKTVYPTITPKKEMHPDAIAVMDAFGMNEAEYAEYEAENTDLISQMNRGER